MTARAWSDITVTDQFCGAGGSSIGAAKAGLRVRMAMNHWRLAVDTHNTNFPNTDHDCVDISASDPRRYPSTDILITSPECTTHSPAGGNRKKVVAQRDIFSPDADDAQADRSRATMWDVPRFAEYHRYKRIIVENVVEVMRWELFNDWLRTMATLGYDHKIISLNSMFCWPTPQSRDRVYINFWRKKDHAPDLDIRPKAECQRCGPVESVQTWKNGRAVGKYKRQYVYTCPTCYEQVTPYYYAALNALDLTLPATRIGDRETPLRARTLQRIQYGLEKYGKRVLVVNLKEAERDRSRAWPADARPIGSIPTWDGYFGVASPFIVGCANTGSDGPARVRGLDETLMAVHAGGNNAALVAPFIFNTGGRETMVSALDAMPTQETRDKLSVLLPGFISTMRRNDTGTPLDGQLHSVSAEGNHHMLITGAAQISMRDSDAMRVAGLDAELMTQGGAPQQGIISRTPMLDGTPRPTPAVDDCYFRMLQPEEIGRAMAFPQTYTVLGTKRDRVKQYGNAVTPPAMETLIERNVQSMTGARIA